MDVGCENICTKKWGADIKRCLASEKDVWRRGKSWDKNGLLDACASTRRNFCRVNRFIKYKSLFASNNSFSH